MGSGIEQSENERFRDVTYGVERAAAIDHLFRVVEGQAWLGSDFYQQSFSELQRLIAEEVVDLAKRREAGDGTQG